MLLFDISLAIAPKALNKQLCVNSNISAIPNYLATNYTPYESSMSQLSGDTFFSQLG